MVEESVGPKLTLVEEPGSSHAAAASASDRPCNSDMFGLIFMYASCAPVVLIIVRKRYSPQYKYKVILMSIIIYLYIYITN